MAPFIRSITAFSVAFALAFCLTGCMAEDHPAAEESVSSSTEDAAASTSAEETDEAEQEAEPEYAMQECALFRMTLPQEIAQYIDWDNSQEKRIAAYYGEVELFEAACYDLLDSAPEWKSRTYSCGFGADESGWHEVKIAFPYLTADGTANATKGNKSAKVLALKYLLGVEEADIYSTVEIQVASGENLSDPRWDTSYPVLLTDDADADNLPSKSSKAKSSSSAVEEDEDAAEDMEEEAAHDGASPFWGVWIGSFQDSANAGTFASEARAAGWSGAAVYTSTDWSDLNSKRWYVVSLGEYGSESDADAALKKAHKSHYKDAYVKFTGDYIG